MPEDIRLLTSWRGHRKQRKLRRLLGYEGEIHWIYLLLSVRENKPDGKLTNMTNQDIADDADWEGDANEFVRVLCDECRLLDRGENGDYRVHDWEDHNPYAFHSKDRSEKSRRAALIRHGVINKDDPLPDDASSKPNSAKRMPDQNLACQEKNGDAPSPSPSPSPIPLSFQDKGRNSAPSFFDIEEVKNLCQELREFYRIHPKATCRKFDPGEFIGTNLKNRKTVAHPGALLHALRRLNKEKEVIRGDPRAYVQKIFNSENPKYTKQQADQKSQRYKDQLKEFVKGIK